MSASIILAQCFCSGRSSSGGIPPGLAIAVLFGLWMLCQMILSYKGTSVMNKWKNIAIVVILAGLIAGIVIAKSQRTASPVPATTASAIPASAVPRMVDLGSVSCIPCKMMAPILKELETECAGRMTIEFIDVWQNPQAGRDYGINLIPTQIFYDAAGKELFRHEGFYSKEDILSKWKELGVDLSNPAATQQTHKQ